MKYYPKACLLKSCIAFFTCNMVVPRVKNFHCPLSCLRNIPLCRDTCLSIFLLLCWLLSSFTIMVYISLYSLFSWQGILEVALLGQRLSHMASASLKHHISSCSPSGYGCLTSTGIYKLFSSGPLSVPGMEDTPPPSRWGPRVGPPHLLNWLFFSHMHLLFIHWCHDLSGKCQGFFSVYFFCLLCFFQRTEMGVLKSVAGRWRLLLAPG